MQIFKKILVCDCSSPIKNNSGKSFRSNDSTQCSTIDGRMFFNSLLMNVSLGGQESNIIAIFCNDNALALRQFLVSMTRPELPTISCKVTEDSPQKCPPLNCNDESDMRV